MPLDFENLAEPLDTFSQRRVELCLAGGECRLETGVGGIKIAQCPLKSREGGLETADRRREAAKRLAQAVHDRVQVAGEVVEFIQPRAE